MGGRGSLYAKMGNKQNKEFTKSVGDFLLEDEPDTTLSHEGMTESLLNKRIHIKQSTDNRNTEVFHPNLDKINNLTNKYTNTVKVLNKNKVQLNIRSTQLSGSTVAQYVSNPFDLENMRIVYNSTTEHHTKKLIEERTQEQIDLGYWVKTDKDELVNQTTTHEFGHYMMRTLMARDEQTKKGKAVKDELRSEINKSSDINQKRKLVFDYYQSYAHKYYKSISRIARKKFGTTAEDCAKQISEYGKTNYIETFAELFASLNCNKKPPSMAKALDLFLKKQMPKRLTKNK